MIVINAMAEINMLTEIFAHYSLKSTWKDGLDLETASWVVGAVQTNITSFRTMIMKT